MSMPNLLVDQSSHHVIWNLFLAFVPVALAFIIALGIRIDLREHRRIRWVIWAPLLFVWLIFLPNTCYLLTEWRHYLKVVSNSNLYFESNTDPDAKLALLWTTLFFIVYTGMGVLTFFLSVWPLDRLIRPRLGPFSWLFGTLFFVLVALGVYLGLVNRFNSWQLARPAHLIQIVSSAIETLGHPMRTGVIVGFGASLWLIYATFDIWMDGAIWRLRKRGWLKAQP